MVRRQFFSGGGGGGGNTAASRRRRSSEEEDDTAADKSGASKKTKRCKKLWLFLFLALVGTIVSLLLNDRKNLAFVSSPIMIQSVVQVQQQQQQQQQQKGTQNVTRSSRSSSYPFKNKTETNQQQSTTGTSATTTTLPAGWILPAPTPYKFYVYDHFLNNEFSPYNLSMEIIKSNQEHAGNCDWALSTCIDDGTADFRYSSRRKNSNADVVLADLFLRYPTTTPTPTTPTPSTKYTPFATRTLDPNQADVFIVPYAHDSHCKSIHFDTWCRDNRMEGIINEKIFSTLKYFNNNNINNNNSTAAAATAKMAKLKERHLFLTSTDYPFSNKAFVKQISMRTTIGDLEKAECLIGTTSSIQQQQQQQVPPSSSSLLCHDFVIPYVNNYPDYQPTVIASSKSEEWWITRERKFALTAIFGPLACNRCFRNEFLHAANQIFTTTTTTRTTTTINGDNSAATATSTSEGNNNSSTTHLQLGGLPVKIGSLGAKRDISHEQATYELYQDSIFCLILPGDGPAQKRFFDVIMSGCIPVVFVFDRYGDNDGRILDDDAGADNENLYYYYPSWWDGLDSSIPKQSSIRTSYPFAKGFYIDQPQLGIDWESLVIQIRPNPNNGCNFGCGHNPQSSCTWDCLVPRLESLLLQQQQHDETTTTTTSNEIVRLRKNLMQVAGWCNYGLQENAYQSFDAFAVLLTQLGHTLERMTPLEPSDRPGG